MPPAWPLRTTHIVTEITGRLGPFGGGAGAVTTVTAVARASRIMVVTVDGHRSPKGRRWRLDLIEQLRGEHQEYVQQLTELAEIVEGIRVNGRGGYFIVSLDALLEPLTTQLDAHASREEAWVFPRLVERAPDSPVALMLEEHRAIRVQSARFARWYRTWRAGADDAYAEWAAAALDLRGLLSTHMQKENLILFPLARRVMTTAELSEWAALGAP